ncbi:hypothetical protein BsWGS_01066 [Bradybaena similaris]
MESWCLSFLLCFTGVVYAETLAPLSVKFNSSGILFTQESELLTFGCEINRNLSYVARNNIVIVRKSATEGSEYNVSEYPNNLNRDSNYKTDFNQVPENGIFITLNISKVRYIDEGKFICRVKDSDGSTVEDVLDVEIKKPLNNLSLEFNGSYLISTTVHEPIEEFAGNYTVACIANGSNPAPSVYLLLNENEVRNSATQTLKLEGKLKQYKTIVNATIPIKFSDSIQEIKCNASSQLGDNRTVTIHVKTKNRDPEVYCNKTEAYEGQKHPNLTCMVEYEGFNITKFSYYDEVHTVEIPEEHIQILPDKKIRVFLKLDEAKDWHFKDFYLLLSHSDGHVTRVSVKLHKIEGPSVSSTIVQDLLMTLSLVALASWLIMHN